MQLAQTLDDIFRYIHPDEPISGEDSRYVDLSAVRGGENLARIVARYIRVAQPGYYHRRLVTGHRGSGKSTELLTLKAELERHNILTVYVDADRAFDLADVTYLDVLLGVTQQLEHVARENDIKFSQQLLESVSDWFAETVEISERQRAAEHTLGAEFAVGAEVPLFARMLASVTGQIKSGSSERRETRRKLERRLDEFLSRLGDLVVNLRERARNQGFADLVVIVDSLERMPLILNDDHAPSNHELLFVYHAEQLQALPCHTIYTVPISLTSVRNLIAIWGDIYRIPMVKIRERAGGPWRPGRAALMDVVSRRVAVDKLFKSPALVERLVEASGGAVRDLIHLLIYAAEYAPEAPLTERAVEAAIAKLVRHYDNLIHVDDLKTLADVRQNPLIAASAKLARLMFDRLVLPYMNFENWVALHPAVEQSPKFQAFLAQQTEVREPGANGDDAG